MGQSAEKLIGYPTGVFVSNDEVFMADSSISRVRKLLRNGQIVTIAGTGIKGYNGDNQVATDAELNEPYSVAVSCSNQVYISEFGGNRIRKIDQFGMIHTIAGTGIAGYNGDNILAINAQLNKPMGLFVTEDDEVLFGEESRVRKIDRDGIISTIAGNGKETYNGDGKLAILASLKPNSVFQYKNEIYIADMNHRIRKVDQFGIISTIAGTGKRNYNGDGIPANIADIHMPLSVFVHNDEVYFTESHSRIRKIHTDGLISTIAEVGDGIIFPRAMFIDSDSQIYISDDNCIKRISQYGKNVKIIVGKAKGGGYSGDVRFNFKKYPHIGPRRKHSIKPFPNHYYDLLIICVDGQ